VIYPDTDPKEWAETHKIELKERQCVKCKKMFPCDIPIALKGYRGFQIKEHGCGEEFIRSVMVPVGENKEKWDKALFGEN